MGNEAGDRLLIVNADDLGLHEDINRGIYQAHTQGIVTSASVVACGEAFDRACTIMQECLRLDVGVHLTLVAERPVCPPHQIPTLVGRDGRFLPSYRHFTARLLAGRVSRADIRRELQAQIERVIAAGRRPSHLDSHQHVHLLPPVWRVTHDLARAYGIRWIRVPHFASLFGSRRSLVDPVFRVGLNVLSGAARWLSNGAAPTIRTAGAHLSGRLDEAGLLGIVSGLPAGISELITHPGVTTPELSRRYPWNYEWSTEMAALTSAHIRSALRSHRVTLTRFSECQPA